MTWSPPQDFERTLAAALEEDLPYLNRSQVPTETLARLKQESRPAAVLLLFGFPKKAGGEARLLLTRRSETVETHRGQVAFPGGVCDPEDGDCRVTALRETEEEVGIPPQLVRTVGSLPELATYASKFWVTPVVGLLRHPFEEVILAPNPREIAHAEWVPLGELTRPGVYRLEHYQAGQIRFPTHVFEVGELRVWGATAAMVRNLLDRLARIPSR